MLRCICPHRVLKSLKSTGFAVALMPMGIALMGIVPAGIVTDVFNAEAFKGYAH